MRQVAPGTQQHLPEAWLTRRKVALIQSSSRKYYQLFLLLRELRQYLFVKVSAANRAVYMYYLRAASCKRNFAREQQAPYRVHLFLPVSLRDSAVCKPQETSKPSPMRDTRHKLSASTYVTRFSTKPFDSQERLQKISFTPPHTASAKREQQTRTPSQSQVVVALHTEANFSALREGSDWFAT